MWQLARQPKWIAALFLCLGIAAGFAFLGQWQLERGVESGAVIDRETETVVALSTIATAQSPVNSAAAGQLVSVTGTMLPGEFVVLNGRFNQGVEGYWVVGHLIEGDAASEGASLAVALGWAESTDAAASAISKFAMPTGPQPFTGRYLASEPPQEDDFEAGVQKSLSVAALVNQWETVPTGVYGGYLVAADAPAGLVPIDSPVPESEVTLNWLNVFYAVEWAVFAVFAVFLWFRLVKDAWEREQEEAAELN